MNADLKRKDDMRITDDDVEHSHKDFYNEENRMTTGVTWTSVHKPQ